MRAAEVIIKAWWPAEVSQLPDDSLGQCQPQSTGHTLVLAVDMLFFHNCCHSEGIQFLGVSRLYPQGTHSLPLGKAR